MAKHVFILGAGASASAGAPLMNGFIDTAERLHGSPGLDIDHKAFALVFRGISALKRAHSNARLDVDNVESVMGAFEAAALFGHLAGWERADVERLPSAVRTVITETIEGTFKFPRHPDQVLAPRDYADFVKLLQLVPQGDRVALVTFNYDLGLDFAVHRAGAGIDYALTEARPPKTGYRLLKLHGSLNWRRVTLDNGATEVQVADFPTLIRDFIGDFTGGGDEVAIPFAKLIARMPGPIAEGAPVIVPPTWSKSVEYKAISSVWKAAADELRDAEHIYVFGFSLPITDAFFPMLFALGTIGDTRLKSFRVFDPEAAVASRFEQILGPVALRRFRPYAYTFRDAVSAIPNLWHHDAP